MSFLKKIGVILLLSSLFLIVKKILKIDSKQLKNQKNIAIIYPISCSCIDDIRDGFIEQLSKYIDFRYTVYDGSGDKILLNSQVQDILNANYDAVCAIATSPYVMLVEQTNQKNSSFPIVGCAADAIKLDQKKINRNYIDVSDEHESIKKINVLIDLYNPEKIIIVYSSLPILEEQVNDIINYSKKFKIKVIPVNINNIYDINIKVAHEFTDKRELVLILGDSFMMSNMEILANLCRKSYKFLVSSDLESVNNGSVLGYGIEYRDCGRLGADKMADILVNNKKPYEIENEIMSNMKIKVNLDNPLHKELNLELLKTKYKDSVIWHSGEKK